MSIPCLPWSSIGYISQPWEEETAAEKHERGVSKRHRGGEYAQVSSSRGALKEHVAAGWEETSAEKHEGGVSKRHRGGEYAQVRQRGERGRELQGLGCLRRGRCLTTHA
jgi:hypothetical protein